MNKKIIYIIAVALAVLVLMALLWWWFLRREATNVQTTGTFGTAQNASSTGATGGPGGPTNVGTPIPQGGAGGEGSGGGQVGGVNAGGVSGETNINVGGIGTGNTSAGGTSVGNIPSPPGVNAPGISGTPGVSGVPGVGAISSTTVGAIQPVGDIGVPGVVWLSGAPGTTTTTGGAPAGGGGGNTGGGNTEPTNQNITTNGPGTVFNPKAINSVAASNASGNGGLSSNFNFGSNGQQVSNGNSGFLATAALSTAAGVVTCAMAEGIQEGLTSAGTSAGGAAGTAAEGGASGSNVSGVAAVQTFDLGTHLAIQLGVPAITGAVGTVAGNQQGDFHINTFLSCVARKIARVAINDITNSVVNWINSGFNGSPAFVQNPTRFFSNVADEAAGQFIQGSALSFLCSPFQLQIKIAIAQSYANQNSSQNSCSIAQVSNNIRGFMRGNFLSGNWASMLSFTTVPTNNPFGAFLYGSVGLNAAVNNAVGQQQTELAQGQGFLSFKQKKNCNTTTTPPSPSPNTSITSNGNGNYTVCDLITTTPGTIIQNTLVGTENSTLNELNLAKNFDEILNALITQLMTKTLQEGLSNLSGADGYASNFSTADQQQAEDQVQGLLTSIEADIGLAQQYGSIQQGSIQDIESTQSQLNTLYNCWSGFATSSPNYAQAQHNADTASSTIASLNDSIDAYNNRITLTNKAIATLDQLESRALSANSTSDVASITNDYKAAKSSGQIPSQADVTNAQQNRTTLQGQMSALNQQTSASLSQCYAAQAQ